MKQLSLALFGVMLLWSCSSKESVDTIVYNAHIYTVNEAFDVEEAMAIRDGKIVALGKTEDIQKTYEAKAQIDGEGRTVYPGFIDAHAHFYGYGASLQSVDLIGAKSWQEVLQRVQAFAEKHPEGWIVGRGWDQNQWDKKVFPDNIELSRLFPNRSVYLTRVDGHAAIANAKAFEEAGVKGYVNVPGGEMPMLGNKPSGILIDNAMSLVGQKIPARAEAKVVEMLQEAEKNCFAAGLTTIDDCGLDFEEVDLITQMQKDGRLKMRLYIMLSDAQKNYDYLIKKGAIKTDRLQVRGFKVYADGALGSRGACLLAPYSDRADHSGFLLSSLSHFEQVANKIYENNFQMCTHAIGDSANRAILNIYNKVLKGKNDKRWRIEHAQVVNEKDFDLFGKASVVPSVQPTHATSDMYWAEERLGAQRVRGAYAYKQLLAQNGWLALGTDFPVEQINPMLTFYAATVRQDAKGWPEGGFQMENSLSPEEALRGMTIWAAKSNFEENEKGSLEKGKLADFIMMDTDIVKAKPQQILKAQVLKTFLNGEKVYEKK